MSDNDKLKEQIAYGKEAEEMLSNRCYQDFKIEYRATLLRMFENTKYKDKDDRDEIWRKFQTLGGLEKSLERYARDGRLANDTLVERIKNKLS